MNHFERARKLYQSCDGNTLNLNKDPYEYDEPEEQIEDTEDEIETENEFKKIDNQIKEIIQLLKENKFRAWRAN